VSGGTLLLATQQAVLDSIRSALVELTWKTSSEAGVRIQAFMAESRTMLDTLAASFDSGALDPHRPRELLPFLHRLATTVPAAQTIYLGDRFDNAVIISMNAAGRPTAALRDATTTGYLGFHDITNDGSIGPGKLEIKYAPTTQPWYQAAIERGTPGWTDIHIDATGGSLVLSHFHPLAGPDGHVSAVLGVDLPLGQLDMLLTRAVSGTGRLAWIVDRNGLMVAASNGLPLTTGSGNSQARLPASASTDPVVSAVARQPPVEDKAATAGQVPATRSWQRSLYLDGKGYFVTASPFGTAAGLDWTIHIHQGLATTLQSMPDAFVIATKASLAIMGLGALLLMATIWACTGTIKGILRTIGRMASGDLDKRQAATSWTELGNIQACMDNLAARLAPIISAAADTAGRMTKSSTQVIQHAATMTDAAIRLQGKADSILQQATQLDQVTATAEIAEHELRSASGPIIRAARELEQAIMAAHGIIEAITTHLTDMARQSQDQQQFADWLAEAGAQGLDKLDGSVRTISRLAEDGSRIQELAGLVISMSEQSIRLAMNATIEAAHAGEAGWGFAIVAEELRKLAECCADNARSIQHAAVEDAGNIAAASMETRVLNDIIDTVTEGLHDLALELGKAAATSRRAAGNSGQAMAATGALSATERCLSGAVENLQIASVALARSMHDIRTLTAGKQATFDTLSTDINQIRRIADTTAQLAWEDTKTANELAELITRFHGHEPASKS
jgi:methyl-accepting chemotaxis protein